MFTIIIICIGFISFMIMFSIFEKEDITGKQVLVGWISGMIGIIGCILIGINMFGATIKIEKMSEKEIVSVRNIDSISGNFCLGTGTIEGTEYLYTMVKEKNGAYTRRQDKMSDIKIYMTNVSPRRIVYNKIYYGKISKGRYDGNVSHIDIYVPYGTIIEKFEVR